MNFVVVGCSYRSAPLDLRERLALAGDDLSDALRRLHEHLPEVLLLSTCNRVEAYAVCLEPIQAEQRLRRFFAEVAQAEVDALREHVYCHVADDALQHIFRVTSSLDAMVVGEPQITGQVKEAFAVASQSAFCGPLLTRCMQRAFSVAKRVRNETEIARHPASVSSVAVDLAKRVFDDLTEVAVLVIGAGEMAELAVRHLVSDGVGRLRVANRNPERARTLAEDFGAHAVGLESLDQQLEWADVIISSTGSPQPIIGRDQLARAMRRRKQRPLFIVDIAVPRDVEPKARSIANLYLFGVDDLERMVADNLQARRKEARAAERIVAEEVTQFRDWLRRQGAVPVIKLLRRRFTDVAHEEAERAARRLGLNGSDQRVALQAMGDAIVKKLLHVATMELKRSADLPHGLDLAEAAKQLFALRRDDDEGEAETDAEEGKGK